MLTVYRHIETSKCELRRYAYDRQTYALTWRWLKTHRWWLAQPSSAWTLTRTGARTTFAPCILLWSSMAQSRRAH